MRAFPDRPIVGVGAVIFDADRVLLVKRGHEPLKGQWTLPGGTVEIGETLEAAVAREIMEETGLAVDVGPVVEVVDRVQRTEDGRVEYHFIIVDYLCYTRDTAALARGSDAAEAQWVEVGDLEEYRVPGSAIDVILKARRMLL